MTRRLLPIKWKVVLGCIGVATIASLVSIGLAYLFLRPKPDGSGGPVTIMSASPEDLRKPAAVVLDFMERLPTELAFYCLIAAVAVVYLGWRCWSSAKLRKEFEGAKKENKNKSSLTSRDWWVVQDLRERALAFRTLAGVLLSGVIALLFGGVYLTLLVLPQVLERDRLLAQETLLLVKDIQRANVKRQFDRRLQLIGEGRYWFEVADVGLGDTSISEEMKIMKALLALSARVAPPRLHVLNTHEVSKKGLAIFATGYGNALVALDGGQTWSVPKGLELKEDEWIAAATFGPDGRHGVVVGHEGSVFVTQNGGQTWSVPKGLKLKEGEWIITATFGPDGRHGVVVGHEGSVFVTQVSGFGMTENRFITDITRIRAAW